MRRLLAPILSPRWVISMTAVAVAVGIADLYLYLSGTVHVLKLGSVRLNQSGEQIVVGGWGHQVAFSLVALEIVLALPGFAWGAWFLWHFDSLRKPAQK